MSTIEERLARDIEAVTRGVVVTESDLREAREDLEGRLARRRADSRRRGLLAAAAAAAVVAGVVTWQGIAGDNAEPSPAPPAPTPSQLPSWEQGFLTGDPLTPEVLAGVWRLDNPSDSRLLFLFTADGAVAYDDTGQLTQSPLVTGTYALDGDAVTLAVDGGTAGCAGRSFEIRAVMSATGPLHVLPTDLAGGQCQSVNRRGWVLERVLPDSGTVSPLTLPPGNDWPTLVGRELVATWWDPTGGFVVELRPDGSYAVLAGPGEIIDAGTWVDEDSSTRLRLTSSAATATCREGDQFVLSRLRGEDVGTLGLQGDLERNDCDLPWTGKGWFRLAP